MPVSCTFPRTGTYFFKSPDVEWTAIKRTNDNRYQAVADEGENGFTAEKGETFLQSVYTPVVTPAAGG